MILRALSKYLSVALVATSASTAVFAYLYREALQDVARIEAEARADELASANERWAARFGQAVEAYEAREAELERRLEQVNQVAADSAAREREAAQSLRDFVTAQEESQDPEYREWARAQLPSDVVTRLEALTNED